MYKNDCAETENGFRQPFRPSIIGERLIRICVGCHICAAYPKYYCSDGERTELKTKYEQDVDTHVLLHAQK